MRTFAEYVRDAVSLDTEEYPTDMDVRLKQQLSAIKKQQDDIFDQSVGKPPEHKDSWQSKSNYYQKLSIKVSQILQRHFMSVKPVKPNWSDYWTVDSLGIFDVSDETKKELSAFGASEAVSGIWGKLSDLAKKELLVNYHFHSF